MPSKNEPLAEFFGILLGDGSVTKYFIKIYLNRIVDAEYALFVQQLTRSLFSGVSIQLRDEPKQGTVTLQISSKDTTDFLRKIGFDPKTRTIPAWIIKNTRFAKATMRGLFDTEGSVGIKFFQGKRGNRFYKQLTFTNKNKNILNFIENNLVLLGYHPTKNSKKNIYISNGKDIDLYQKQICAHNPKLTKKLNAGKIETFTYGGLRRMVRHQS